MNIIHLTRYDSDYDNICVICFHNNNPLINLKEQMVYIKKCNCNSIIHTHCLRLWHSHAQKCPICRIDTIRTPLKKITIFTFERIISFLYALVLAHFVYVIVCYIWVEL